MNDKYVDDHAYETPSSGLRPAGYDEQDVFGHEDNHQVCRLAGSSLTVKTKLLATDQVQDSVMGARRSAHDSRDSQQRHAISSL